MARKKTSKLRVNVKASISRRLRDVRQELFGEHGGPELARRLSLPARTWYNYETGVTVPAEVLLTFIDQTGANPIWLLSGDGERFRTQGELSSVHDLSPIQLIRKGLEKLERLPRDAPALEIEHPEGGADLVSVDLVPITALADIHQAESNVQGNVLAYRSWLPHPDHTIAVRLEDESMFPILPCGSVVAVDRSITDPQRLQGRMVAANPDGRAMIRWLDISGRHLILRANQTSREFPLIPMEIEGEINPILGQIVWSWSCFNGAES